MRYIILFVILTLLILNPAAGFKLGDISPDYSPYIEKYLQLITKGELYEKKLALYNLPYILSNEKYRKDPKVFNLIIDALKDKDPSIREAATASLKKIGEITEGCCKETQIVPSLIKALKDRHGGVRREAAKALGFYNDTRAAEPLINILKKDKDSWVRLEAAYSLGKLNAKKSYPALFDSLKETNTDWRRKIFQQECLIAGRKIGYRDARSIRLLIKNINDEYLKAEIIKTLGQFRSMAAKDVLFNATQDKTAIIRKLALQAIDRMPLVRSHGMSCDQHPKTDLFIKSLKDPSAGVRAVSAECLGKTADNRAVGPLIDALHDNDTNVQKQVILSLAGYNDIKILTALVPFLGSPVGYVAEKSFSTMAEKTAEGTVFVYKKDGIRYSVKTRKEIPVVFKTENPPLLHFTVDELIHKYPTADEKRVKKEPKFLRKVPKPLPYSKHIIHPVAVTALIQALTNFDAKVKIGALKVITPFEDDRIEPVLIELLKDQSSEVRILTLSTLYNFATLKSLSAVVDSLYDQDDAVRKKAAIILGRLKNKRTMQPLLKSLNDNEENVSAAALNSLQNFDSPQISDANIRMLEDESPHVRKTALSYIKKKPDKRAVESIIPLLADSRTGVLAAEVLGIIGDKRAIDPLMKSLNYGYGRKGLPPRDLMIEAARVLSSFEEDWITPYLIKKVGVEPPFLAPRIQIYKGSITKAPFLAPVMRVFQRYGDRKTLDTLKAYLYDTDKELRKGAMFLFGMYQEKNALKQLEPSLKDPDPEIQAYTKELIACIYSGSLKKIKESIINQPGRLYDNTVTAVNPYTISTPMPILKNKDGQKIKGLSPRYFSQQQGVVRPRYSSYQQEIERKESLDKTLENEQHLNEYLDLLRQDNASEKRSALLKIPEFLGIPEYKRNPSCIEPILKALIHKDPSIREAAAEVLNKIGKNIIGVVKDTSDIVSPLNMALYDEYPEVRRYAAEALALYKDKSAATSLIERVYDENSGVRCDAAYSLGEIKAKEAIPSFLDLFKDHTDWNRKSLVRKECLVAMRKMGYRPTDSVPLLIENFNDEVLKKEIIRALSRSYPPDAVETRDVLLKATNDPDDNVRRLATEAIAELSRVSARRASKNDYYDLDFYIKSLKDPSAPVKAASIRALSKTKDARAVEPIIQALHDRDENVQREAIIALGKFRDEKALSELVPFFGSPSTKLRQSAVESFFMVARNTCDQRVYVYRKNGTRYVAKHRGDVPEGLGKIESIAHPHAVDSFIHALNNDNTDVKIGILREIRKLEDDRIEPQLINLLRDPSSKVRLQTLMQLYNFATQKAEPQIAEALMDKDSRIREKSAWMLGVLENKQAVQPLLDSLNDSEIDVRRAAILALGNIKDNSALEPLIEKLSDSDFRIREASLNALSRFDDPLISNPNLRMLKDDSPDVRNTAISNIKKKPDKKAVDSLILLLEDPDNCILAAEALGVIGDSRAAEPLIRVLNGKYSQNYAPEKDKALKLSAIRSLGKLRGKTIEKALLNIVNSSNQKIYLRIASANILGEMGNKKAVVPLINILTDNQADKWLRAASASALGDIGDKRAVKTLTKAANEPLDTIRNAAQDALNKIVNNGRDTKTY